MSDASAMVERCGRHQHPELWGGKQVDPWCSAAVARAIVEMSSDRAPVPESVTTRPRREDWWNGA